MRITDWDDAYANRDHIPNAEGFIARWPAEAAAFRDRLAAAGRAELGRVYGPRPRNRTDLFRPEGAARGLVVFVHGGYWKAFDVSFWSQFAEGALAAGWAVALPGYTLAPEVPVAEITREVTAAIADAAGAVAGPVRLVGHSAGGHLATRMLCANTGLPEALQERIVHTVSISGVHDLRPLLRTEMNADLRLDEAQALAESPALMRPIEGARVSVWVGGDERPEFVRQSTLLANIWTGLGADMRQAIEPGRHHFDVIDGLRAAESPLMRCVLG